MIGEARTFLRTITPDVWVGVIVIVAILTLVIFLFTDKPGDETITISAKMHKSTLLVGAIAVSAMVFLSATSNAELESIMP